MSSRFATALAGDYADFIKSFIEIRRCSLGWTYGALGWGSRGGIGWEGITANGFGG
jgi:hypothetical protein